MRFSSIQSFLTLADTLNYTEAAERLYVTQSALSRVILQMEEELGVQLFSRSRRGVELTPAGVSFAEDMRKMSEFYDDSIVKARSAHRGDSGSISIACHRNVVEDITMDLIAHFSKDYPKVSLNIQSMPTSRIINAIDEKLIECAISPGRPRNEDSRIILLKQYRECVAVSPEHHLANRKSISVKDLKDEPFVIMAREYSTRGHDNVISRTKAAGFSPKIFAESTSVPHMTAILSTGKCVSFLSENYKSITRKNLIYIPLKETPVASIHFMYNCKNPNPVLKTMVEYIEKNYKIEPEADYNKLTLK
jgi:DNA-binding transcriptional LysR family regulator